MATGNLKGITIEIGGDTTGLNTALNNMNKQINSTQKELREVDKLLKLDPGNTELIAQKQRLLSDAVNQTANKLETLRKVAAEADEKLANGTYTQTQYDEIRRQLINAENEYANATRASDEFNNSLSRFNQKAQSVSEAAGKIAEKTKALSAAAGLAATALIGLGVKAAQSADELLTVAKQTGMSTDALQEFKYASDLLDVNFDDATSAITKMKRSLTSSASSFDEIGVKIKDQKGDYRDIEDIFYDTISALGRIENETERDTAAMQIFGKSADQLAGFIDDGGKALKELSEEARTNGSIIPEEDLVKANELNDALDHMKARLTAAFSSTGVKLAEAFTPVVEKLAKAAEVLAGALAKIPTPILTIITVILLLVALISPVAMGISNIASAVTTLTPIITAITGIVTAIIIPAITAAVGAIGTAITAVVAFLAPIAALLAAIGLVAAAVVLWVKNWDTIQEAVKVAGEEIGYAVNDIKNALSSKWSKISSDASAWWGKISDGIVNALVGLPDRIRSLIETIKKAMQDGWNAMINSAKEAGKNLMDNLVSSISEKFSALTNLIDNMKSAFDSLIDKSNDATRAASNASSSSSSNRSYSSMVDSMTINSAPLGSYSDNVGVISAIDSLADAMSRQQTNVTVTLQGDARGVFKLVRQENNRLIKSTGFHALA